MSNGIPKGFTPWSGGTRPVDPGTTVEYVMDHGGRYRGVAKVLHWGREQGNHIIAYRVVEEEKPAVEIPEGFTPWAGGECPVDKGARVQVLLRDGDQSVFYGSALRWSCVDSDGDIIAYRVIEEEKPVVKIPDGFTPWSGGECPVGTRILVDVILADGKLVSGDAGFFDWNNIHYPVLAYRVIEEEKTQRATTPSAPDLLDAAAGHLRDRAATYDKPEGERSMAKTVAIFNLHHDTNLTEAQGWHLLQILKDVRLFTRATYHADSAEDCIAYAALKAESMQKGGA